MDQTPQDFRAWLTFGIDCARSVPDALDPKAASILENVRDKFDALAKPAEGTVPDDGDECGLCFGIMSRACPRCNPALAASPEPTTVESSGMVEGIRAVTAEMRWVMPNACGEWADKIDAFLRGDFPSQNGTFACPICGQDTPHHHTPAVVDAYHNKGSRK